MADEYHKLFYNKSFYMNVTWFGIKALKNPLDLWIYQEIIYQIKPTLIIECGTFMGGSAYFLASILDLMGQGQVISIDISPRDNLPQHKRIKYIKGSSVDMEIVNSIKTEREKVMIILDSKHTKDHVLKELEIYSRMVSLGSYIIVEDTNLGGHPIKPEFKPGPWEAVEEFLKNNKDYIIDKEREKFLFTFNPNGYLKRIK